LSSASHVRFANLDIMQAAALLERNSNPSRKGLNQNEWNYYAPAGGLSRGNKAIEIC